eukprot:scaffold59224_cov36-Prasinocladus_malaysianus.AAC.1
MAGGESMMQQLLWVMETLQDELVEEEDIKRHAMAISTQYRNSVELLEVSGSVAHEGAGSTTIMQCDCDGARHDESYVFSVTTGFALWYFMQSGKWRR